MMAIVLSNIAETNLFLNNNEDALETADESIKYATEIQLFDLIFHNLYIKSQLYNNTKSWSDSIKQLEIGLEILKNNKDS